MALYTAAQWAEIQVNLPRDERTSYAEYLAGGAATDSQNAIKYPTKSAGGFTDSQNAARLAAEAAARDAEDAYSTVKVGTTGKTQAQLDAAKYTAEAKTATEKAAADKAAINKAAADKAAADKAATDKAATDKAATDKAATDKAAADKAATDKIAADKIAADKAAADKAAADKAAADKAAAEAAAKAEKDALKAQIDALIAAGKIAEAAALAAQLKAAQDAANAAAQIAANTAASKLAYDFAARDKADAIKIERVSAYQNLKLEFEKYGLGSLVESVEALIMNGTPKSEATLKLRATPQYQLRFAGNTQRLAAGKNLYDESTYLALENDFQTSFEAYGQKALLGKTRESAQAMFADYIGSDKSPTEIKDRIRLAVEEVDGRKDIKAEFQKFFPEITDSDLVSYFLKPKETLSALTAKVRVAQIGSAASAQGLNASLTTATDLEQLGLTEQQARTGYQRVATDLPTIGKLGDIDKTNIGQTTAENAYLKGLASEQRKIDQAAERERSRFAQSSGMNKVSLTDTKPAGQY